MQLYVLRHGDAERQSSSDRARPLTARGKQEVEAVALRHQAELAAVQAIFVSPYERAQQTAAIVNRYFPDTSRLTLDILTPNHRPMDVLTFLRQQPGDSTLLLVSHQPLVSELVGDLCDRPAISVAMHTAALAGIGLDPVAMGMGQLQFID